MAIKPFNWTDLKKVSGAELSLLEGVFRLVPETEAAGVLGTRIRKTLMKHLGERSFYYLDAVATENYGDLLGRLPDGAILSMIAVEPSGSKILAHIDSGLAFLVIDKLLGGGGESFSGTRPLSETEQGVLQYLIMQILSQVWEALGGAAKFHFRFERFAFSAQDVLDKGAGKGTAISLVYKVGIGELSGFVKLVFQGDLIKKAATLSSGRKDAPETGYFMKQLDRYNYIMTSLWADGGRATLSSEDIIALEAGDVVLFDETGLIMKDGRPAGEVDLRAGRGEEACLKAEIDADGKVLKCRVIGG